MQSLHTESPSAHGGPTVAAARREQQRFFAGFTFNGDANLEALASFYGLVVPGLEPGITLTEYMARTCHGNAHLGYRIALGNAALVVREIEEGMVRKVGLSFFPIASHQHRSRRPHGKAYNIGVAASRTSRRGWTGVADPPR